MAKLYTDKYQIKLRYTVYYTEKHKYLISTKV